MPQIPTEFEVVPPVIGVSVAMGSLPWQDRDSSGIGYRISGAIPLVVGGRYLLFLTKGPYANCSDCGTSDQFTKSSLDMFAPAFPYKAVIAISNGMTCVPEQSEAGEWKLQTFDGKIKLEDQLFNLNEGEVIERLNNTMLDFRKYTETARLQGIEDARKNGAFGK